LLSYQHIYHAGNFADVQKHSVLIHLLKLIKKQHKIITVLDTHSGRGLYNLNSKEAKKTEEFVYGIKHFWNMREEKNPLSDYLNLIKQVNNNKNLTSYPGSAKIIEILLRNKAKITLAEKHPKEIIYLKESIKENDNIKIYKDDGFNILGNIVFENKTLVIIDPSYEVKDEYNDIGLHIYNAYKKNQNTTFFIWYPILKSGHHYKMLEFINTKISAPIICGEIILQQQIKENFGMFGSGLIIINPPEKFETGFDKINRFICKRSIHTTEYQRKF